MERQYLASGTAAPDERGPANGWQPSESETGEWIFDGVTADEGRDAIGLYGLDPIISDPSLEERCRALAELLVLAGVS